MKDVPKLFEYLKSTNVGESQDPNATEGQAGNDEDEKSMLAYGYHVYNGFQLRFDHPTDKSIAHVNHRDVDLEAHPSVTEHGHDGQKEGEFDDHVFDS
jgi:hypothetical protein